jgi:hypothetical protein
MFPVRSRRWLSRESRGGPRGHRPRVCPRSCLPRVEHLEDRLCPATLTVINTDDSGLGSFRQAILDSNASVGVLDTIAFNADYRGALSLPK